MNTMTSHWRAAADWTASLLTLTLLSGGAMPRAAYNKAWAYLLATEALVRRLLVIAAQPLWSNKTSTAQHDQRARFAPRPPPKEKPANRVARSLPEPQFRLTEPRDGLPMSTHKRATAPPPRTLDSKPAQIISTLTIKRRLTALQDVLRHPNKHIARMAAWQTTCLKRYRASRAFERFTPLRLAPPGSSVMHKSGLRPRDYGLLLQADTTAHALWMRAPP